MRDPAYRPLAAATAGDALRPPGADAALADITRDTRAFTAAIRTRLFTFLRAWSIGDHAAAVAALPATGSGPAPATSSGQAPSTGAEPHAAPSAWTAERLKETLAAYRAEHSLPRLDPEGRNLRHTHVAPADDGRTWRVQQVLVDDAGDNDWMAEFVVDLAASRAAQQPVITLDRIGLIG